MTADFETVMLSGLRIAASMSDTIVVMFDR